MKAQFNTMALAHKNSRFGACKFGGKPAQYFAQSLKLAHKGIDLEQIEKSKKLKREFLLACESLYQFLKFIVCFCVYAAALGFCASQVMADEYCTFSEGKPVSIVFEGKIAKNLLESNDELCPGTVETEKKNNPDKTCVLDLQKVKKYNSKKYECFYK